MKTRAKGKSIFLFEFDNQLMKTAKQKCNEGKIPCLNCKREPTSGEMRKAKRQRPRHQNFRKMNLYEIIKNYSQVDKIIIASWDGQIEIDQII